ncbi:MAG: GNAT family N-acetyltransferase [Opitutaceae bacterium]|nr:GNAT family N-acetyltransferase [Opitutaceae bacterium]
MLETRIRRAAPGDEEKASLVASATFLDAFAGVLPGGDIVLHAKRQHAAEAYRKLLAAGDAAVWLAEVLPGEAPVGYAVLCRPDLPLDDLGETDIELKRIYLLSRFRGHGLGRRLLHAVEAEALARHARRLLLGVYGENEPALAFYRATGFEVVGERLFEVGEHRYRDKILAKAL